MSKSTPPKRFQAVKQKQQARRGEQRLFSVAMVALLIASLIVGFNFYNSQAMPLQSPVPLTPTPLPTEVQIAPPIPPAPTVAASNMSVSAVRQRYVITPLVGIVSGHKGYDPGAVCDDGLTEAELNYAIAIEVTSLLGRKGVNADLLDEFDDRLTEYTADALVSIHSDSCNIPGATGFKVARVTDSAIPQDEDLLVGCLNDYYGQYTGLSLHPGSITDNMTDYHAFREISRTTPGAIIETGFMLDDRYLLQHRPKIVARGIAAGILCFLDQRLALAE